MELDSVYEYFCCMTKDEISRTLEHKTVSIKSWLNNKKRRVKICKNFIAGLKFIARRQFPQNS